MMVTSSILCLLLATQLCHSIVNRNCFTSDCRSRSCCSETQCLQNPLVHYDTSHQCPCMIPQNTIRVSEGTSITLECDPGGVCLEQCEWTTPMGSCQYKDAIWMCDDMSIRFLFLEGTCTIHLIAEEWHTGLWTCRASPYHNSYTDQVQVVVTPHGTRMLGDVWWKDGWRAALLWTSLAVILIIIFAIFLVCISGLCPSFGCCGWRTSNKESKRSRSSAGGRSNSGNGEEGGRQEEDDSTYQKIDVLGADRIAMPSSDTYSYTNILVENDDGGTETDPEDRRVEYSDPQHYDGRHGGQTRTARKLTNLDTDTLEERIRKASGIASTEQLI